MKKNREKLVRWVKPHGNSCCVAVPLSWLGKLAEVRKIEKEEELNETK